MPLISLIVTTYKQPKFVRRICDCLARQDLRGYEVIFTDDRSPDETYDVVMECSKSVKADRVVCRRNESNLYAGRNRNAAASEAFGEYVWFFDCDDIINEGGCAAVRKAIEVCRPQCLYVGFYTITAEPRAQHLPPSQINPWSQMVIPDTKIIRRDLFRPFGPWRYCEDFEWWFRQSDAFTEPPVPLDFTVVNYDRTSGGITDRSRLIGVNPRTLAEYAADIGAVDYRLLADRLEQNAALLRLAFEAKNPDVRNAVRRVNERPWLCLTVI